MPNFLWILLSGHLCKSPDARSCSRADREARSLTRISFHDTLLPPPPILPFLLSCLPHSFSRPSLLQSLCCIDVLESVESLRPHVLRHALSICMLCCSPGHMVVLRNGLSMGSA